MSGNFELVACQLIAGINQYRLWKRDVGYKVKNYDHRFTHMPFAYCDLGQRRD